MIQIKKASTVVNINAQPVTVFTDPDAGFAFGVRGKPFRKVTRGYVMAHIKGKFMAAHRLIWESVNGIIPNGLQVNHINGIKSDNRITNLELVTARENCLHAYATFLTSKKGERNGRAKLKWANVEAIRSSQAGTAELALLYGVSKRTVQDVRSGKNWSVAA